MNIGDIFENAPELDVKSIMTDSRKKGNDAIFFCIKGMVNDGHDFIEQAIENGAICIVHSRELQSYHNRITYIKVADTLNALNYFTAYFYGNPTASMKVFGVTGTNGKSTIGWVTRYIENHFSKCGYIGTIGTLIDNVVISSPLTTPDAVYLHSMARKMFDEGCRSLSMEVSSIGLEEGRVDSIAFDYVSFTNLTHDHLDYHGNFENYYKAKKKLFMMGGDKVKGFINIDDEYGARLYKEAAIKCYSYAIRKPADYRATDVRLFVDHSEFNILYEGQKHHFWTNLVAEFNVYNLLNVLAVMHQDGHSFEELAPLVTNIPQVLGRMENIVEGQPFNVIVDYAHTPDGFEQVFKYARAITPSEKRIIVVFGCAGARDRKKRPVLGKIADENCKMIVLTSEDPRQEDPEKIADEIREGISVHNCLFVEDRYDAIRQAIELANKHDTVLILGKGDEDYMDIKGHKEYWMGDQKAAREIIHDVFDLKEDEEYEFK